jgi:beta-glucosidase
VRWNDNPAHSQDREIYPGLSGKVRYEEGLFIGYRHYDRLGIVPMFPFGFGLSYTSFALGGLEVDASRFEADGAVTISVEVTNTGDRTGSDVVQLYVSDPEASLVRPQKELKGFAKVTLQPGETKRVTIALDDRAFAFYAPSAKHWLVEKGRFIIRAARHAADPGLTAEVTRETTLMLPV